MANALVQFRIDDSIRQQASDLCAQLGFDLSTYLRMSLNKLVQERGVPFNLKLNTVPTAEEAIAAMKKILNATRRFEDIARTRLDLILQDEQFEARLVSELERSGGSFGTAPESSE